MIDTSKKCTLKKLASVVGVAPSTVSRVLSGSHTKSMVTEQTVNRIREAANRYGYLPNINAKRLLGRKAFVIGLEVPSWNLGTHSFADISLVEMMRGIEDVVSSSEYKLMVLFKNQAYMERQENLRLIRQNAIDGLLIWGGSYLDSYAQELCSLPVVFVNTMPKLEAKANYVSCDNFAASFDLASHALEKGCRKILYIAGPSTNSIDLDRMEGFKKALSGKRHGNASCVGTVSCDYTFETASRAMSELLERDGVFFDCVICANDNMALGVMDAARKRGLRIPDDFKLAGGDGLSLDAARCGLTTFDCNAFQVGRLATQRLMDIIASPAGKPVATKLPCELKHRESL